jgi:hypothetical protein
MKVDLHVSLDIDERRTVMIVRCGDEFLGQVQLPFTGVSMLMAREHRDALAGVFLASLTAAVIAQEKAR